MLVIWNSIGYSYSYALDLKIILSSAKGATGAYGYWMHPVGDGCSGYQLPVWLAAYSKRLDNA
jgi:hypothetical protein